MKFKFHSGVLFHISNVMSTVGKRERGDEMSGSIVEGIVSEISIVGQARQEYFGRCMRYQYVSRATILRLLSFSLLPTTTLPYLLF